MPKLNNPDKTPNDGKVKMPEVQAGMNRKGPAMGSGDKDAYDDDEWGDDWKPLGQRAKKDANKDADILDRARKRMEREIQADSDNRKAALEDIKFKKGDQWPADVAAQRNEDKRPCLTINKIPTFCHQIINDIRANRPDIVVSPTGDGGDKELAKFYRSMIRAIERSSSADIAYDTAAEAAVDRGRGFIRLRTDWESPKSFNQSILIERVRNPFTVYLDSSHQEPDGADCNYAFETEMMPIDEFKIEYPDADTEAYDQGGIGDKYKEWSTKDGIRIANYYERVREPCELLRLSSGWVGQDDELTEQTLKALKDGTVRILERRESFTVKIMVYLITATQILKKTEWLGKWIPLIPVIGEEIDVEGKVFYNGIIRNAKDSQRMYNYWKTSETELIALAPKAPWVMAEGQDEGYEQQWDNANVKSYSKLVYVPTSLGGQQVPAPQRQQFAGVPAGVVQAALGAAQDMMATTGVRFDPAQPGPRIDESGRATREHRRTDDLGNFHYDDNLGRALKHLGRQLIDLIPRVYDTNRQVTILHQDGKDEQVIVDPSANKPYEERKGADGKVVKVYNPTMGKFGVTVTIGPSFATKRIEASESMMDFAKALPATAQHFADLIAKYQDWPGAEEIAARLAKLIPANMLTEDMKDVPPQVQALIGNLQNELKAAQLQIQQAALALADRQKDRDVQMAKINADFETKLLAIVQKAEAAQADQNHKLMQLAADTAALKAQLEAKNSEGSASKGEAS